MALSTRPAPDRAGRERIAYRDLGVEQLGAVYETLLDYEPRVDARIASSLETGSGVRKATGTFYTPQPIADYLVRRTLGPLVRDAAPDRILQLRVVDPAMGSGAFLVAACRYLAAAYEAALVRAGGCHASDIGEAERVGDPADDRRALPVRRRPQSDGGAARAPVALAGHAGGRSAAQLSRSSPAGRRQPARRVARAPAAAADPAPAAQSGDSPAAVRRRRRRAVALREALPVRFSLETMPNDTLEQVRAKERAFAALTGRDRGAVAVEADRGPVVRGVVRAGRRPRRPRRRSERCPMRCSPAAARCRRAPPDRYLDAGGGGRRRAAVLSLGARVSRGVLRSRRRAPAATPASTR